MCQNYTTLGNVDVKYVKQLLIPLYKLPHMEQATTQALANMRQVMQEISDLPPVAFEKIFNELSIRQEREGFVPAADRPSRRISFGDIVDDLDCFGHDGHRRR
jgi:hypothetical protein